ncbi:outer membrane protein [Ketogulonicigenium robustum]|uniref:Outer membrane protein n=1 Tax=Ketogulonicigenium robustum TaxID=92947 RepID=A0A1W6P003_9RHOB|nr:autotransporter assembly complex family protein [Ketogulonicigenium robustum]ARO14835.1 outer membrane protein [Ketogulonicigenium robustum]
MPTLRPFRLSTSVFALALVALPLAVGVGFTPRADAQQVNVNVSGDADGLESAIRGASLSFALTEDTEGENVSQDYVAAARADYRRILTALYAQGYYGGTISIKVDGREASTIAPLSAPARIGTIAIDVTPGPQFRFGTAAIGPLAPDTELPDDFTTGEVARANTIRDAANRSTTAWREAGHARATVASQQITAIHDQNRLDATVTLRPGPQLTFGTLTITGNERVRTDRIQRIAGYPEGAIFSPDELDRVATRLRRTGAFQSVSLQESDTIGPNNTQPIAMTVAEMPPRRLGFGAEISTDEGLALSTYWMHRNIRHAAQNLRFDAAISGIAGESGGPDYSVGVTFKRPGFVNYHNDLTISALLERQDEADYLLDQLTLNALVTRYIYDNLTVTGGFGLLIAREESAGITREYTLLTMPLTGTLDNRDNALSAKSGWYLNLAITPFIGLSDIDSGVRLYGDARYYHSFGERLTFAAHGQLGSVVGPDVEEAPTDYLFYSGGGGTVRGQSYKSLGIPITRNGQEVTLGGTSFIGAQLEARFDLTNSISLVGFYDLGMVGADPLPSDGDEWQSGAGLGLRYNTPIGPIRLDVATPANGDDAGKSVQVYIGIGQAF